MDDFPTMGAGDSGSGGTGLSQQQLQSAYDYAASGGGQGLPDLSQLTWSGIETWVKANPEKVILGTVAAVFLLKVL